MLSPCCGAAFQYLCPVDLVELNCFLLDIDRVYLPSSPSTSAFEPVCIHQIMYPPDSEKRSLEDPLLSPYSDTTLLDDAEDRPSQSKISRSKWRPWIIPAIFTTLYTISITVLAIYYTNAHICHNPNELIYCTWYYSTYCMPSIDLFHSSSQKRHLLWSFANHRYELHQQSLRRRPTPRTRRSMAQSDGE